MAFLATYCTAKVINNLRTPSSRGVIFGIFIDKVMLKAGYLPLKPHPRTAYAASPSPLERGVNSILSSGEGLGLELYILGAGGRGTEATVLLRFVRLTIVEQGLRALFSSKK